MNGTYCSTKDSIKLKIFVSTVHARTREKSRLQFWLPAVVLQKPLISYGCIFFPSTYRKSQEDLYSYFNKEGEKRLETIRFQHVYEVQKFGKSPIEESILTVLVPTRWRDEADDSVIEIARVNQTFGLMEGKRFYCTDSSRTTEDRVADDVIYADSFSVEKSTATERSTSPRKGNHTFERFSIEENPTMTVPPENRTLYLNCTNPAVECTRISCKLGTFASSLTVAKLTVTLDMQLKNFRGELVSGQIT